VDEMVRDADLTEVRDQIGALRGYNVTRALEKLVDDDGSIRRTFSENPLAGVTAPSAAPAPVADGDLALAERPASEVQPALSEPEPITPEPEAVTPVPVYRPDTPAFIPPGAAPPPESRAAAPEAPAFIPPEVARAAGPPHVA
jgi:sec-independent protein translocase protein TatB